MGRLARRDRFNHKVRFAVNAAAPGRPHSCPGSRGRPERAEAPATLEKSCIRVPQMAWAKAAAHRRNASTEFASTAVIRAVASLLRLRLEMGESHVAKCGVGRTLLASRRSLWPPQVWRRGGSGRPHLGQEEYSLNRPRTWTARFWRRGLSCTLASGCPGASKGRSDKAGKVMNAYIWALLFERYSGSCRYMGSQDRLLSALGMI